jgi:hypothetical protein
MPPNEQMFKIHGYSGPCPKPVSPTPPPARGEEDKRVRAIAEDGSRVEYEALEVCEDGKTRVYSREARTLARRVLELESTLTATEARLAEAENTAKGLGIALGEALSQRDAAVAIAREAVDGMEELPAVPTTTPRSCLSAPPSPASGNGGGCEPAPHPRPGARDHP